MQSQHSGDPPAAGADGAEGASRPHGQAAAAAGKEAVDGSVAAQRMQHPGGGREVTGNTEGEWGQRPRESADGDREGDVESLVTQPNTALVPRGRWPNSHPSSMRTGYIEAAGPQFSLTKEGLLTNAEEGLGRGSEPLRGVLHLLRES